MHHKKVLQSRALNNRNSVLDADGNLILRTRSILILNTEMRLEDVGTRNKFDIMRVLHSRTQIRVQDSFIHSFIHQ
jgi:hypothetical protein